jgi:DNA polymerase-3 subunit alpha
LILDEIISIEPFGTKDTCDIHHKEDHGFFINEPNYICNEFLVHNSGVIISDVDLDDKIPIVKTKDGEFISGFQESGSCTDLLEAGFIKFDILGINNLDIVKEVIENLPEGKAFDIEKMNQDDKNVYKVLNKDTEGLFQISSKLMQKLIVMTKPENQDELSDLLALGRPGPLSVGSDEEYVNYKQKPPTDIPEFIKSALGDSHYVLLYQEQVMKIFMNLDFSEKEADDIRGLLKKIQKLKLGKVSPEEKVKLKELGLL